MSVETLDISQAVNDLVSFTLHKRLKIVEVLHSKVSDTSNSMYVIIKCNNGGVYEIGISDHINHSHQYPLGHIVDRIIPRDVLLYSMKKVGIDVPDVNMLNGDNYYSILPCSSYNINPEELKGKKSSHLAFVSDCYQVRKAHLLDNNQVLDIDYTSINHQYHEERKYVNYDPIQSGCSSFDIAIINYLKAHYNIQEARYIYYHKLYKTNPINDNPTSKHTLVVDNVKYSIKVQVRVPQLRVHI